MQGEAFYLDKNCNNCNNPLQVIFNENAGEWDVECVVCLKKHISIEDIAMLPSKGYKIATQYKVILPKQKLNTIHPAQIIEIDSEKKISISRTGKFYFVQLIINDKKTPLRPFNSLSEVLETYPELNDKKINI